MPVRKKYRVISSSARKKRVVRKRGFSFKLPKIARRKRLIKRSAAPSLFRKLSRPIRSKKKNREFKKGLRMIFKLAILLFVAGLIGMVGIFIYFSKDIPNPDKIVDRSVAESTKIYDCTGEHLLYEIHGEERRTIIELDQVSQHL
ncbi:hypothetical protein KAT63_04825, partial [Candidatus Parcubacteria bacterium]|nr:hypothetical protein [Candidatus Parcubacteria bacterium]